MPDSNNVSEFWKLFSEGRSAIRPLPKDRWTKEQLYELTEEHRAIQACWLFCPVDTCDPKFFGISQNELIWTDPQHRILLELVWEAMEDAGVPASSLYGTNTGVFSGVWRQEYLELTNKWKSHGDWYRNYMGNSIGTCKRINIFSYWLRTLKTIGMKKIGNTLVWKIFTYLALIEINNGALHVKFIDSLYF